MRDRHLGHYWAMVAILALTYAGTGHWVIAGLCWQGELCPLWPPAALGWVALVLYGPNLWPGLLIGAGLLYLSFREPPLLVIGAGVAITLQVIIGERLLRHLKFSPHLEQLRDILSLISAALLSTALSHSLTLLSTSIIQISLLFSPWNQGLADFLGILVIAPFLFHAHTLLLTGRRRLSLLLSAMISHWAQLSLKALEIILWLILLLGTCWTVLGSQTLDLNLAQYPLEYLPFTLIIWAALRFGQVGAIIANLLVATITIIGGMRGGGPFIASSQNLTEAILLLQIFMGVMTITALVLATNDNTLSNENAS